MNLPARLGFLLLSTDIFMRFSEISTKGGYYHLGSKPVTDLLSISFLCQILRVFSAFFLFGMWSSSKPLSPVELGAAASSDFPTWDRRQNRSNQQQYKGTSWSKPIGLWSAEVPPESRTSPKCNHLFLGPSATLPEHSLQLFLWTPPPALYLYLFRTQKNSV